MDASDPENMKLVHGFVRRDAKGIQIIDTWDTLGMRATQSQDTVLDRVFVPDDQVVLVCPPGFGGAGLLQVSIFAWALMGFASTYLGAAKRAFDLTVESMPKRSSIALTNSMAHHPGVQHVVSDMRIAYDAAEAMLERTCADWAAGVQHPDWPVRLVATRSFVIDQSVEIVDRALDLSGGAGTFKRNRLEQLFRDVRMGHFHPGNSLLAHELVGKLCLGVNPDDPQRWG
jgi:alkylation response protein AidB-like acyl-CoA dehydrogenase